MLIITIHKWGKIICPYGKCRCRKYLDIEAIRYHLYKDDFKSDYWIWTRYGEVVALENQFGMNYIGSKFSGVHIGGQNMGNATWEDNFSRATWEDNFSRYEEMILNIASLEFGIYSQPSIEVPN